MSVGLYGTLGGGLGAIAGWFGGGLAGAAALGQLGSSIGIKIASYQLGLGIGDKIVNKALQVIDTAAHYALRTGTVALGYWLVSQNMEKQCSIDPTHTSCDVFKWVTVSTLVVEAAAVIVLTKHHIDHLDLKKEPEPLTEPNIQEQSIVSRILAEGKTAISSTSEQITAVCRRTS